MSKINPAHIGSSFDDFLSEEGQLEAASAVAVKRVVAWQIAQAMKAQGITKLAMARRMNTSRAALDRLLNEDDPGLTLATLTRAAQALGRTVRVELSA